MKKTLTVMTLLAGAVSVYSQGSVSMNDYNAQGNGFKIQVFQPQSQTLGTTVSVNGYTGKEVMGQSANSYLAHPGTTVYSGQSTIGAGFDVGLLALDGGGASSYAQLSQVAGLTITTWNNNAVADPLDNNYGMWASAAIASIPGGATSASVAIAAWQATGTKGAATTLLAAQQDGYEWGVSSIQTATVATGSQTVGYLPTTITSFSLIPGSVATPEPSTIALGVIGASALLFRRRK